MDTKTCGACASCTPRNSRAATPTISKGTPLMLTTLPTAAGAAEPLGEARAQHRDGRRRRGPVVVLREQAARAAPAHPSTAKNPPETTAPSTRSLPLGRPTTSGRF